MQKNYVVAVLENIFSYQSRISKRVRNLTTLRENLQSFPKMTKIKKHTFQKFFTFFFKKLYFVLKLKNTQKAGF